MHHEVQLAILHTATLGLGMHFHLRFNTYISPKLL